MYFTIVSCLAQAVIGSYIPWSRYPAHPQVVVTPQGYLADTPEVAAAKAAHFAEVARRGGAVPPGYGYYPVVNSEGFLEDTPEVAAAKAAHFAEHARARALAAGGVPVSYSIYHYPYSLPGAPVLLPNGYLADTPEVTAAKVAHFAEHARALLRAG